MPPHCDTMDGPVVNAARRALDAENANLILPYAPKEAEKEIREAFDKIIPVRKLGKEAKEVAELWFFDTVVRLHRAGEGAPHTGLKPAGLPIGPVIPLAEEAIETGSANKLIHFLSETVSEEINEKLEDILNKKRSMDKNVESAREYVKTMLGFQVWSHHLYTYIKGGGEHRKEAKGGHEH